MKRIALLFLLILCMLPVPLAFAANDSIDMSQFKIYRGTAYGEKKLDVTSILTDNNTSTSIRADFVDRWVWSKFSDDGKLTVTIGKMYFRFGPGDGQESINSVDFNFYDAGGNVLKSFKGINPSLTELDVNIQNVAAYGIKVNAVTWRGNLTFSGLSLTGFVNVPEDPSLYEIKDLTASGISRSNFKISWAPVSGTQLKTYRIYLDGVWLSETTKTEFTFYGLNPSKDYSFMVSAVRYQGEEYKSSTGLYVFPPPSQPIGLKADGFNRLIRLSWTANKEVDVVGYNLFYVSGNQINTQIIKAITFDVPASPGIREEFYITAVDARGRESIKSATAGAAASLKPPEPPLNLAGEVGNASAVLTWSKHTDPTVTGYNVYQDGVKINKAVVKDTSYKIDGLTNKQAYNFWITAVNEKENQESSPSNTVTLTPHDTSTTVDQKPNPAQGYLLITWTEVVDAVSYDIYYQGKKVDSVGAGVTSYKLTTAKGYNPNLTFHDVKVIPILKNGGTGTSNPGSGGIGSGGWGFGAKDVITNGLGILAWLAGFVLLGIVVRYVPILIKLVREAVKTA